MQQERESADLCLNGCGFFGAPGSGGMCSVCWKKTMSDRQVETSAARPLAEPMSVDVPAPSVDMAESAAAPQIAQDATPTVAAEASTPEPTEDKLVQKNKKRCWECKKKVGLTAIECRCGYVFCSGHRYADQHNCSFDFKTADRAELARRNPGGGQFGKLEKL